MTVDIPTSGVNVEGWMQLNAEFLALKLSFGDEPQEKHALIRCWLSKEMEVGEFKSRPRPKPIQKEQETYQSKVERPSQLKSAAASRPEIEEPWPRPGWYDAEEAEKAWWEQELYQEELERERKEKLLYMEKQAWLQEEIE